MIYICINIVFENQYRAMKVHKEYKVVCVTIGVVTGEKRKVRRHDERKKIIPSKSRVIHFSPFAIFIFFYFFLDFFCR